MINLYQGDCLELMNDIPDGSVDLVLTDPPYCSGSRQQAGARNTISKNANSRKNADWFVTDNMGTDTYVRFIREIAKELFRVSSYGSPAYVFTDWRQFSNVVYSFETIGWTLKNVIVWDKAKGGSMGSWWRNNHEWICAFTKGKARQLVHHSCFNTWTGTKPKGGVHPTVKPVELIEYVIGTDAGIGPVLDPFMGSGSTGVAAKRLGRDFIGIELDEKYFDIAKARIESEPNPIV